MSMIESLYETLDQNPQDVAVLFSCGRYTYGDLLKGMERYASSLISVGIRPADRVVVRMRNHIEAVLLLLGCMRIGAIAVPLNTRLSAHELCKLLGRLKPSLYAGEDDQSNDLSQLTPEILPGKARYWLGRRVSDEFGARWEDFLQDDSGELLPEYPNPQAPAALLATSGTTAEPKFVAHTPLSLAHVLEAYEPVGAEVGARPIMLSATPLSHVSGFVTALLALRFGRTLRLIPQFDPQECLAAIEADRCSWFLGAPFMFTAMSAAQRAQMRNLSSLRFCFAVGDVLRPELAGEILQTFGVEPKSLWGATEVMGSVVPWSAGSVGRPAPGAQVRLVDERGYQVRSGETGEFQVQGPNLTIGYWQAPGKIDAVASAGWFATGDLMRFGPEGQLWFEGRKKELIICGGVNISPLEVEAVLLLHPSVIEAGVTGVAHPELGEVVVAAVRLRDAASPNAIEDVLELTRQRLADYKVPVRLRTVAQLPRNPQGKIDRRALSKLMAA
jgi:acyl-coenzyme A synthetase/AMP-(fatty) acid ligase